MGKHLIDGLLENAKKRNDNKKLKNKLVSELCKEIDKKEEELRIKKPTIGNIKINEETKVIKEDDVKKSEDIIKRVSKYEVEMDGKKHLCDSYKDIAKITGLSNMKIYSKLYKVPKVELIKIKKNI